MTTTEEAFRALVSNARTAKANAIVTGVPDDKSAAYIARLLKSDDTDTTTGDPK